MKKITTLAALLLVLPAAWAGSEDTYAEFKAMMDRSFQTNGIAAKHRMYQLDFQKACSVEKQPSKQVMAQIEAAQLKTIRYPADGKYFGNWKEGEKIAVSGRGLTWTDQTPHNNGGGCYNCHQMSHHEVSYGTIGPSLLEYGKVRGNSDEIVKYTWGKIYNAKAFNACSNMPRNGDAEILTEQQIKHLMAFLFDPASPVNQK
ncbi:sulfur oxidation c-type cytochrome SoxX [Azonexus sp.]|uniref:sulfur oxidation c-type cytochrome SoxX n=1 Tax=Azonexus sp. TaxID=1872668 RepID=UPI0027B9FAD5|nr:sulfur oxidation c-type cytochrome SoxX [Azonexus sp.]